MSGFDAFTRSPASDGWFEVYEISPRLFAIQEPGHFEEPISSLLLGEQLAALIDTGCGVGDLRGVVDELTDLPVVVVNTHTHIDHLGGNRQFERIAMLEHPRSREVAEQGVGREQRTTEILAPHLRHPTTSACSTAGRASCSAATCCSRDRSGPTSKVAACRTLWAATAR